MLSLMESGWPAHMESRGTGREAFRAKGPVLIQYDRPATESSKITGTPLS